MNYKNPSVANSTQWNEASKTGSDTSQNDEALMVKFWNQMTVHYGSLWEKTNGAIGGYCYAGWRDAFDKIGVNAWKAGIQALIDEGSQHPPNLMKFKGLCRKAGSSDSVESFVHGKKPKPTPFGMPLSFLADGDYTAEQMRSTGFQEDAIVAERMERQGWTYQQYRQARCRELNIEYQEPKF